MDFLLFKFFISHVHVHVRRVLDRLRPPPHGGRANPFRARPLQRRTFSNLATAFPTPKRNIIRRKIKFNAITLPVPDAIKSLKMLCFEIFCLSRPPFLLKCFVSKIKLNTFLYGNRAKNYRIMKFTLLFLAVNLVHVLINFYFN